MQLVFDALVTLLAPILAYTADEAWEHAGYEGSVHEADFPEPDPAFEEEPGERLGERLERRHVERHTAVGATVLVEQHAGRVGIADLVLEGRRLLVDPRRQLARRGLLPLPLPQAAERRELEVTASPRSEL